MGRSRYRPFRRMSGAVHESTGKGEGGTKRGTPVDDNRQGEDLRNVQSSTSWEFQQVFKAPPKI